MNRFTRRILICLAPLVIFGIITGAAVYNFARGSDEGFRFKLGVDLVGGTILVYETDKSKELRDAALSDKARQDELAAAIKRRIDPTDLYNITVRPVGDGRVEIILPTGGPGTGGTTGKKAGTIDDVESIKRLIAQVGSLEFRIFANARDDRKGIEAAMAYVSDPKYKDELRQRAEKGLPPPPPIPPDGKAFDSDKGRFTYSWVELGRPYRASLHLHNAAKDDTQVGRDGRPANELWKQLEKAREEGKAIQLNEGFLSGAVLYSRQSQDRTNPQEREKKQVEYFILARDPWIDPETGQRVEVTGKYLTGATPGVDEKMRPAVTFRLDNQGGSLFHILTSQNTPKEVGGAEFPRYLAILLDGQVDSAATIISAISTNGQISGDFTQDEVNERVRVLRSGALPATLKPQPVSENTMGSTLGADTIRAGSISVVVAFVAVMIFMVIYYRFAGLVASIALLANLLLTVGFMVAVNATFTLPGLAGLVLMLGMAVDANVLIYERLREERERGASLALALRNGYDRAFPTIIDTHLSSIFTALVLYAVGNDQLKGFGISLAVGLVISLFTSLYMTRLIFDFWQSRGWLTKLSMFKFFSRPNINFMRVRYYWFTASITLSVIGMAIFLARGEQGLNIDFVGGTLYSGQLDKPYTITQLRERLSDGAQAERLKLSDVRQTDAEGRVFELTYADGKKRTISLANATTAQDIRASASQLPDLSVEQIYLAGESTAGGSRFFTIRTTEKRVPLVAAAVDRLLGEDLKRILLQNYQVNPDNRTATLTFTEPASVAQLSTLVQREFNVEATVNGEGEPVNGRYGRMSLALVKPVPAEDLTRALTHVKTALAESAQPERLENFDSQLAQETRLRALYAILASWGAILLYLWFRFGNWTFGLAAVLCLIHDLTFTLGIIAVCHYLHEYVPWLAGALLIQDFKIDLPAIAALLTLVGYSVNDTIVVFDRIREVRGKNPLLTATMINDSVNQTLSRTVLASLTTWLVVIVLYIFGGEGVHLFAFVMVVGIIIGTYSSIYIASPLLLIFGEGTPKEGAKAPVPAAAEPQGATA